MRSFFVCCVVLLTIALLATPAIQAEEEQTCGPVASPVDQKLFRNYNGTVEHTTEGQRGRMSIDIKQSDREGYVQLKMTMWDGLSGEGTLLGVISTDGKICATGTFSEPPYALRPSRAWYCNLIGVIRDNTLRGNYSFFPRTVGKPLCPQVPGYICPEAAEASGSFDLRTFTPIIQ